MSKKSQAETGSWVLQEGYAYYFDQNLADGLLGLFNEGDRVIELGAGLGCYSYYYYDSKVLSSISASDGVDNVADRTGGLVKARDLTQDQDFGENRADWVVCFEVAEHIPQKYQAIFIGNILKTSPSNIVLSWGVPSQGGVGHVNLRENTYVISLLRDHGYDHVEAASQKLRDVSQLVWFRMSLMVFHKR